MAITAKTDLSSNFGSEYGKFQDLAIKGNQRTATGNTSWTSITSGTTYDTSTSSDPNILNKGENGLFYWLGQTVLINNVIDAAWINGLIQAVATSAQIFAADSGSTDAYAISLPTAPTAYVLGMMIIFRPNTANTGACTLNVNGLGAKSIKDVLGNDLQTGDILAGQMVTVIYNGTDFIMTSTSALETTQDDGWKYVSEAWAYASATTITVPTGAANRYQKGDKIKLTNSTVKYFYIVNVADTLLTISGGNDYSLANTTIINIFVSKAENPQGFPQWFTFTPTIRGATVAGTFGGSFAGEFCIVGKLVKFEIQIQITSVSGSPSGLTQIVLPLTRVTNSIYSFINVWTDYVAWPSASTMIGGIIFGGSNVISVFGGKSATGGTAVDASTLASGNGFYISGSYKI